jgi:hypothetical protein
MKPNTLGVYQLFENHRRYVVPLYQRPYVWSRDEQWLPLWNDIRERAEAVLRAGGDREARQRVYPHFLGAIVTYQTQVFGREVHAYDVIDGQQRLTTLQIFLAAFRDIVADTDDGSLHHDLVKVTWNDGTVAHEIERYKVWPTNVDRASFSAVLDAGSFQGVNTFIRHELEQFRRRPRIADAYLFFYEQIDSWVLGTDSESTVEGKTPGERVEALFDALRSLLQVVEIALEKGDDPQVIFETLNARGEPLLPSDLVRNYVFTQANRRQENADRLYETYWRAFDDADADPFWMEEVSVGREKRQRIVLFLYHFLTATLVQEVSISHLFEAFKRWWEGTSGPATVEQGLQNLTKYAKAYRTIVEPDTTTRFGVFAHRLQILDVSTLHPVLLHLLVDEALPDAELVPVVSDLESYLARRCQAIPSVTR